jgi:hypothetical protein
MRYIVNVVQNTKIMVNNHTQEHKDLRGSLNVKYPEAEVIGYKFTIKDKIQNCEEKSLKPKTQYTQSHSHTRLFFLDKFSHKTFSFTQFSNPNTYKRT